MMLSLKLSFLLLFANFIFIRANDNIHLQVKAVEETCEPVPGFLIANRTEQIRCCRKVFFNLYKNWATQEVYLSKTLATLKAWNCPQFEVACRHRALAFTKFTSLMYDRFCNQSNLLSECGNTILKATGQTKNTSFPMDRPEALWNLLASELNSPALTASQLGDPCVQVALYDSPSGRIDDYHETVIHSVPYCAVAWCGYDGNTFRSSIISGWTCLPTRCKANVAIMIALFILLAVLITFANATVILVYGSDAKNRHSQGIFRISLGVADVLVGVFIFPCAAAIMYGMFFQRITFGKAYNVSGSVNYTSQNGSWNLRTDTVLVQPLESRGDSFEKSVSKEFTDVVGFFTTLSLSVSIYLLTASGVDRLQAITRPVSYRQTNAKQFATICSGVTWALAIVVSVVPFFVEGLSYEIIGSGFVTLYSSGDEPLILYAVGFFIPLLVTWALSIAMYVQSKKSFKHRSTISNARRQHIRQQRRLNQVLTLMVTAFSLTLVPAILILVVVIFIPGTKTSKPLNYDPVLSAVANAMELTAILILLCNGLWNCLIYSIRTTVFRKNAVDIYRKIGNRINPFNWCKILQKWRYMCTGEIYPQEKIPRRPASSFNTSIRFISRSVSQMSRKQKETMKQKERPMSMTQPPSHTKTCQSKCTERKASMPPSKRLSST